jgi:hypothetical protein
MLSQLTEAEIVNGIVLATVLASDYGNARKINAMRLLRPVIAAAVIIPLFVDRPVTGGTGLIVEIAGVAAGVLMHVYRSPKTGKPVSRAGAPYAALWTVIIGARVAFSYGLGHWFQTPVVNWAIANHVTLAAVTDGLIFMALAMVLVRTLALGVRASRLPAPETASGADSARHHV